MTTTGFSGVFSISNWNFNITTGNINTNNAPTSVTFVSGDSSIFEDVIVGDAIMSIIIPFDCSITFSYTASTNDRDNDFYWDPFGYIINSSPVVLADSYGNTKTGTITVNLLANEVFGFYVETRDGILGSSTTIVSNFIFTPTVAPTITNFSIPPKIFGEIPFTITQPSSNSSGAFNYTSSNLSVATISGNTITCVSSGTSIITATQSGTTNHNSGTITATFYVNQSTPINPVIIDSFAKLSYFMNTSSTYGHMENYFKINDLVVSSSNKVLTGNNITPKTNNYLSLVNF